MSGALALELQHVARREKLVEEGLRLLANPHSYPAACNRAFVALQREGDCLALFAQRDTAKRNRDYACLSVVLGQKLPKLGNQRACVIQSLRAAALVAITSSPHEKRRAASLTVDKLVKKDMRSVLGAIANLFRHFQPHSMFVFGFLHRCDLTMCDTSARVKFRDVFLKAISPWRRNA